MRAETGPGGWTIPSAGQRTWPKLSARSRGTSERWIADERESEDTAASYSPPDTSDTMENGRACRFLPLRELVDARDQVLRRPPEVDVRRRVGPIRQVQHVRRAPRDPQVRHDREHQRERP